MSGGATDPGGKSAGAHPVPSDGFRRFSLLWASQSVSVIGTALTFFAVNIWLTQTRFPLASQKPALALALSLTTLAFILPTIVAAPIAGAWADRHDRRRTMFAMNCVAGALSTALVALLLSNRLDVPMLLAFLLVYGLCGAFHAASFETSYAMLVPTIQLARATGMMQATMALSGVISPSIAALLIGVPAVARHGGAGWFAGLSLAKLSDGTALAVGADAATFFIAALALLGLEIPSPHRADLAGPGAASKTLWHDIQEGAMFVWHRRPMLWLIGTFAMVNFILGPVTVLQPLIVKFNLAADWQSRRFTFASALALLATLHGLGGLAGAVAISAWGGLKRRRVMGALIPMAAAGALIAIYGLSASIVRSAVALFLMGMMWPVTNAHSHAIWLAITPREIQGRVLSVRRLIGQITFPLGTAIAGWLGARFDPGVAVAMLGGCMALFALIQTVNPMLTRIEDRAWLEDFAARSAGRGNAKRE
ncbi:MAG: MFS transporter [Candidatus Eisenbacteria bacterium]|nr:MFS transporter [Candidatus Eisenbacteria bacterium]